jgi:hypothetical protein
MKKQTAVDLLMDKLKFIDKNAYNELCNNGYGQAKRMQNEQMEDAYLAGEAKDRKYFNETYNTETP